MSENIIDQKTYDKLLDMLKKGEIVVSWESGKHSKYFCLKFGDKEIRRAILCNAINDLYEALNPKNEIVIDGITYVRKPPSNPTESL